MKSLHALVLILASTILVFGQSERKVSSTVKDVTVFLRGAQVTRMAIAELTPGQSTIILNGTSPKIQENSIQAEVNQGVKILGVSFRVNYLKDLKKSEASAILDQENQRISEQIVDEKAVLEIYKEEEQMLKANKVIGGQQTGVNVNELKSAVDFYRARLLDIEQHKRQITGRLESLETAKLKIGFQQRELKSGGSQPEGEIVITLDSKLDARVQLKVSYLVQEASWFPLYDIRAINIQSPIGITYKASITQQSGEDWENVKLAVSSANPSSGGSRPTIAPWFLGFNNYMRRPDSEIPWDNTVRGRVLDDEGNPVPGVNVIMRGTSNGTVTDANGEYSMVVPNEHATLVFSFIGYSSQEVYVDGRNTLDLNLSPDTKELSEVIVTGYTDALQGVAAGVRIRGITSIKSNYRSQTVIAATPVVRSTNLEFTIDTPYTIKSGGDNQIVDMIEYQVDAQYQYYCAPKLDTDAFLTAKLTDWDEYNFLEGQASLFFEGKYIGKTMLDTRSTSDTLTLSLGRDRNVVVTREKVKEYSSSQFVGSNKKALFAYEISIRNKKAQTIDIKIEDQLPVPNTKEISVDEIENTNAIKEEASGLLTWNFKVEPGKTEKLDLKYEIKYPKYHNIILE